MIPGITAQVGAGESGTPTERWWRIRFPTLNTGNTVGNGSNEYIDLRFAGLYTTIGGDNLVDDAIAFAAQPPNNPPGVLLANDNGSIRWNNAGNQGLGEDCFIAFKLPVPDDIMRFSIKNHSTAGYSPRDLVLESSWDGINWTFEYGYCYVGWGGGTLNNFDRQTSIDWSTHAVRDWLVRCFKSNGYSNLGIYEMEMASTIGGSDLCTGGTPRSTNNGTYPASNLTDNNNSTLCGSVGAARTTHVGYSFASDTIVNEVRFLAQVGNEQLEYGALCIPRPGTGTPGSYNGDWWYIKQLIEGCVYDGKGSSAYAMDFRNPRVPPSPTGAHRYWRLRPTNGSHRSEQAFSLTALDFKAGGSTLVGSGTAICGNKFDSGYLPSYAFDGSDSTLWHSDNNTVRTWIGYDFGTAVLPDEIFLKSRNDATYYNQIPVEVVLEYSDDLVNWFKKKAWHTVAPTAPLHTQSLYV